MGLRGVGTLMGMKKKRKVCDPINIHHQQSPVSQSSMSAWDDDESVKVHNKASTHQTCLLNPGMLVNKFPRQHTLVLSSASWISADPLSPAAAPQDDF